MNYPPHIKKLVDCPREYLTAEQIAPIVGKDPQTLRYMAKKTACRSWQAVCMACASSAAGDFLADSVNVAHADMHMMILFLYEAGYFRAALG